MSRSFRQQVRGLPAAFASPLFLGLAPVFGKLAINHGLPPLFVVALRTILAALLLLLVMFLFRRQFLYIFPAGLLGCLLAGWINGMGSLLYYSALGRIDASLGQIIYSLYPLFVALWLWFDHQPPSRLTLLRLAMIPPALVLLAQSGENHIDVVGMLMMLVSSMLYALHLPINERVLYEMPAPTVTVYTLLAMSATVMPVFFFTKFNTVPEMVSWGGLIGLTLVTFLSRLTLFMGVKHLGGLQTAVLGLVELLVTISFSHLILGERLSLLQWGGVILLMVCLGLTVAEKPQAKRGAGGLLSWIRPPLPQDLSWPPH